MHCTCAKHLCHLGTECGDPGRRINHLQRIGIICASPLLGTNDKQRRSFAKDSTLKTRRAEKLAFFFFRFAIRGRASSRSPGALPAGAHPGACAATASPSPARRCVFPSCLGRRPAGSGAGRVAAGATGKG